MTKEDILAMEVGAKLDALVHVKIMDRHYPEPLHYSSDISAAFQVVEKLGGGRDIVQIAVVYQLHFGEWIYRVTISFQEISRANVIVWDKTAPLAVSKAALLTRLEGDNDEKRQKG